MINMLRELIAFNILTLAITIFVLGFTGFYHNLKEEFAIIAVEIVLMGLVSAAIYLALVGAI